MSFLELPDSSRKQLSMSLSRTDGWMNDNFELILKS